MENKKKKPIRKKLLIFGLVAISLLSFGLFGMAFSSNDVATASAAEYKTIHCSSSQDLRQTHYKIEVVDNSILNQIVYGQFRTTPYIVQRPWYDPSSDWVKYGTSDSSKLFDTFTLFNTEEDCSEYYFGVGRTTNPNFFKEINNSFLFELVDNYEIEYELYAISGNKNKLEVNYANPINKLWKVSDTDTSKTYYYFPFVAFYQYSKGSDNLAIGGVTVNRYVVDSLSMIARGEPTAFCYNDYAVERLEAATPETSGPNTNAHYRDVLGWTATENSSITVEYINMTSFSTYETETEIVSVDNKYLANGDYVATQVFNTLGKTDISSFNATYKDYYISSTGEYLLAERIVRTANGYTYTYDGVANTGKITITYNDFDYKDVSLRVQNNDPENQLIMDVYTADAVVSNGIVSLTWEFDKVQAQLYNSCKWLFNLTAEDITVSGISDNITVTKTNDKLIVSVSEDNMEELFGLSLTATAEITEDVEYTMTYTYVSLDENLNETVLTSSPITMLYSEVINVSGTNFYNSYGNIVESAISPACLNGEVYFKYSGVKQVYDVENRTCTITVLYDYNTLIRAKNSAGDTSYKALTGNSLNFKASDFNFNVPTGYRIEGITSEDSDAVNINFLEKTPNDSNISITVSSALKRIITITAEITDEWFIEITYLKPYKDSAFCAMTTYSGTIKVSDYTDVYALTKTDLESILGVSTLDILGLSTVKTVTVTFDGVSTYNIKLDYTSASMRKMNSDGSYDEILVPLTSYATWCDFYGKEWSILWLNSSEKKIFNYENDVDRDKLYGFFSVAVFEEQISDLNSIMSSYETKGCKTFYEQRKVSGSGIYQWFNRNKNNLGTIILSHLGIWGCEIADEDNCQVYSYFFYLDGTSNLNYVANNGADDYDDTDSALNNKVEDVGDWFDDKTGSFWDKVKDWWNGNSVSSIVVKVILGLIALCAAAFIVVLVVKFVIWLIHWLRD